MKIRMTIAVFGEGLEFRKWFRATTKILKGSGFILTPNEKKSYRNRNFTLLNMKNNFELNFHAPWGATSLSPFALQNFFITRELFVEL